MAEPLLRAVVVREDVRAPDRWPWSVPVLRSLERLDLHPGVTFLVGENGTGKSTLVEGIAVAAGFPPEGGSLGFGARTRDEVAALADGLRLDRGHRRPRTGFFLRAESFFNVATEIDRLDAEAREYRIPMASLLDSYGGVSLHERSHGEGFLALAIHRFGADGLYVLDEPEAALSPQSSLTLLRRMHHLVETGSQFVIATHSPILMGFPDAWIYELSDRGAERVEYDATDHVRLTRSFLDDRERFLRQLFS
jgi:predicted ATPase